MTRPLTNRQEAFAQHYAKNGNATAAFRHAGYSTTGKPETMHRRAISVLQTDNVQARIEELRERIRATAETKFDLTAEKLIAQYMAIAFADAGDFYEWSSTGVTVKPSDQLTPQQRTLIQHVQSKAGKEFTIEVKLSDRMKALDALARHIGLFELDNASKSTGITVVLDKEDADL